MAVRWAPPYTPPAMLFTPFRTAPFGRYRSLLLLTAAMLIVAPGCVRRRLLIRSNPPGAMVYVDNQPIGTTPCSTDFIYYGTREVRLVKPGFETLVINQPIPAPWYEWPGLDFVSENLVPREIQDYRTLAYNLAATGHQADRAIVRRRRAASAIRSARRADAGDCARTANGDRGAARCANRPADAGNGPRVRPANWTGSGGAGLAHPALAGDGRSSAWRSSAGSAPDAAIVVAPLSNDRVGRNNHRAPYPAIRNDW